MYIIDYAEVHPNPPAVAADALVVVARLHQHIPGIIGLNMDTAAVRLVKDLPHRLARQGAAENLLPSAAVVDDRPVIGNQIAPWTGQAELFRLPDRALQRTASGDDDAVAARERAAQCVVVVRRDLLAVVEQRAVQV